MTSLGGRRTHTERVKETQTKNHNSICTAADNDDVIVVDIITTSLSPLKLVITQGLRFNLRCPQTNLQDEQKICLVFYFSSLFLLLFWCRLNQLKAKLLKHLLRGLNCWNFRFFFFGVFTLSTGTPLETALRQRTIDNASAAPCRDRKKSFAS